MIGKSIQKEKRKGNLANPTMLQCCNVDSCSEMVEDDRMVSKMRDWERRKGEERGRKERGPVPIVLLGIKVE